MDAETLKGIGLALSIAIGLISFLSNSRLWAWCLLFGGGFALLYGMGLWLFGGWGSAWDGRSWGIPMQQRGLLTAGAGVVSMILGGAFALRQPPEDYWNEENNHG